jgi:hypothetical protein
MLDTRYRSEIAAMLCQPIAGSGRLARDPVGDRERIAAAQARVPGLLAAHRNALELGGS